MTQDFVNLLIVVGIIGFIVYMKYMKKPVNYNEYEESYVKVLNSEQYKVKGKYE